jgi:hypothetical protein
MPKGKTQSQQQALSILRPDRPLPIDICVHMPKVRGRDRTRCCECQVASETVAQPPGGGSMLVLGGDVYTYLLGSCESKTVLLCFALQQCALHLLSYALTYILLCIT